MLKQLVVAVWAGVLGGPAVAQSLFREVTSTHLPAGLAGRCMDVAAADVDGDGDLDLALAMEFEPNVLLVNEGAGRFRDASAQLPLTVHDSEDVAFADFDGDGDPDLVLVSEDDRMDEIYLNDGSGRFEDASERLTPDDVSNALALLDLDGDGRLDLLTGNIGVDRVLLSDGAGRFRDETASRWPQAGGDSRTQDLEVFDMDGDGDLDVAVANEGQNQLYRNDGGRLIDVTATHLPRAVEESREIRAADFDGDGDADLVVANVQFLLDTTSRDALLLNDGGGVFSPAPAEWHPPIDDQNNFTVQAFDVDADGDVDIVTASTVFGRAAGEFRVLVNDGAARFALARSGTVLPADVDGNAFDIEVADVDGDGQTDLFLCNRGSVDGAAAASGGLQRLLLRVGAAR